MKQVPMYLKLRKKYYFFVMQILLKSATNFLQSCCHDKIMNLEFSPDLIASFDVISITIPYLAQSYVHDLD